MAAPAAKWPTITVDDRFDLVVLGSRPSRVAPMDRGAVRAVAAAGSVLRGPEQLALEIAEYWYPDPAVIGQSVGFVQVAQQLDGPERTRILIGRRSIGIYRFEGAHFVELNIVGWQPEKPDRLEGFKTASKEDLQIHLPGVSLSGLFGVSADAIGTRGALLGDTGSRRNRLAVTFDSINARVPTLALVVGAVVPTWALHGTHEDAICK